MDPHCDSNHGVRLNISHGNGAWGKIYSYEARDERILKSAAVALDSEI